MPGINKEKIRNAVEKGLDRAYDFRNTNTQSINLSLSTAKIIIFSDQHRGVGDGADDFCDCSKAYSAALGYYLEAGYTLIILGDAEDLWECRPGPVVRRYRNNLLLEAEFLKKNRYHRMYGNHDDLWFDSRAINKHFQAQMPGYPELTVTESLRLTLTDGSDTAYKFFMVHGHQGTLGSDRFGKASRLIVRYAWRPLQRIFKFKSTTPAKNEELNTAHDVAMYTWALNNWKGADNDKRAVLIAGHTHQPVFSTRSFVLKLKQELAKLQSDYESATPFSAERTELERAIARKRAELEYVRAEHGDGNEDAGCPCYFNTGCCSFGDGDVTGIEIANGTIKLVRWPDDQGRPLPKELESAKVKDIFAQLGKC